MLNDKVNGVRLLDWAALAAFVGPVASVLYSFLDLSLVPAWYPWAFCISLSGAVVSWLVWRRAPYSARLAAVLFALFAIGNWFLADGPLGVGPVWMASIVLVTTFGGRVVIGYLAAQAILAIGLHVLGGRGWERALTEAVGVILLAGFGTVFALVLRDGDRVRESLQQAHVEQEQALERLAQSNSMLLRQLGTEQDLVLAQERERSARELHDSLGHRLTAVGLSLQYAQRVRERDLDSAFEEVERARLLVGDSLDAMRRIVRAMHPVELSSLRGTDTFVAIAESFRSTGLEVRAEVLNEIELPREQLLLLVRFLQEGLTNVVRHSNATVVHIDMHVDREDALVSITDRGSNSPIAEVREGFGLRSMRTRAESLGGSLEYGRHEHGFRVAMRIPKNSVRAAA